VEVAEHPFVYLQEKELLSGDELYGYGYSSDRPEGDSIQPIYEGPFGSQDQYLKFKLTRVEKGMSGSPLLSRRFGAVCGIVKSSRDVDWDLGGRAVSAKSILDSFPEIRDWHREQNSPNQQWMKLRDTYIVKPAKAEQVFNVLVGSDVPGLANERQAIAKKLSCTPIPDQKINVLPSQPTSAGEVHDAIKKCDVYIGLLGEQYGRKLGDNISVTELEIVLARNRGKPILLYRKELEKPPEESQQALFDLIDSYKSGFVAHEISMFSAPDEWAERVLTDVENIIKTLPADQGNETIRSHPTSGRRGLIASLGRSPGAVTGLYHALKARGKDIDYVWAIYTKHHFVERAEQVVTEELKGKVDYERFQIDVEEFKTDRDVIKFKQAFVERLVKARLRGDELAIGVTGGRTVMGALLAQVAQLEAPENSFFCQLTVPDNIESRGQFPEFGNLDEHRDKEVRQQILNPTLLDDWYLIEIGFSRVYDNAYDDL
jgi:hypothetical protein